MPTALVVGALACGDDGSGAIPAGHTDGGQGVVGVSGASPGDDAGQGRSGAAGADAGLASGSQPGAATSAARTDGGRPSTMDPEESGGVGASGDGAATSGARDAGIPADASDGDAGGELAASLDAAMSAPDPLPYGGEVVAFSPGQAAGFGQGDLPEVVLGPPMGTGTQAGSLDVLSLGVGGSIVLGFGERTIVDGPGADFIVFENPFWPGGDSAQVFSELAEVSVSADGESWQLFPCDQAGAGEGRFPGCAGWTPTRVFDPAVVYPLDPALTGGDAFDLADVGVPRARFVRIVDLAETGDGTSAGFDLDAVGLVHFE